MIPTPNRKVRNNTVKQPSKATISKIQSELRESLKPGCSLLELFYHILREEIRWDRSLPKSSFQRKAQEQTQTETREWKRFGLN